MPRLYTHCVEWVVHQKTYPAAAKAAAQRRGANLTVVASVCGTEEDPQGLARQAACLERAGALVLPSSAQAALLCARLLNSPAGTGGS